MVVGGGGEEGGLAQGPVMCHFVAIKIEVGTEARMGGKKT